MKNWIPTNIDDFIIFKVEAKEILNFESSLSLKIWIKKNSNFNEYWIWG